MSALRGSTGLTSSAGSRLAAATEADAGVRPMPASDPEQVFFHFDLMRSLQMHKRLALGILAAAVLACAAYVVRGWHNYTAQALVYVQPAPPRLLASGPESRWPYDSNTYDSYIQQQLHNVTRADVLAAAVPKIPGWQHSGENIQLAALRLGRALEVVRVGSGYQISITAKAKDPEKAAEIANAVAGSYIASSTRELRAGDDQRIQLLREERDRVQKELAADRGEQDDLNKKLGVASLGNAPVDPIDEQINAVRAELIKARADNDEAAARVMTAGKAGAGSSAALDAEADDLVASDPGMVSMKTSLNARRSQLITQMANLTPNNPQYKQDSEELAQINSSLETMTKDLRAKAAAHIQQKLKNDLERTSDVEGKLNAQLAQLTASAGTAGPRLQRLNELAADIQRLQSRFALVDEQFRNMLLENNAPGAVYLSAAAVPPLAASRDVLLRNAFVILLAGLMLGWGTALVVHNLDQRIYIAEDVERVLGFGPMAQLPDFQEVGSGVEEEYLLRLAAALEHAYQQGELKSCIFTGVASGSGATTVSTRITGMLEAIGRSTVLVNASGSPAPPPEESAEDGETGLVHAPRSTRSSALLQQMAEETGEDTIVLSDTAPLLVSGETEYLARFVDSAIVVIQSGVTTRAQLRDVAHTLQRLDVSAVGFVLNRTSKQTANPSFRDAVRAVEQRIYGTARPQAAEEKKPKRRAAKKDAAKDGDRDPQPGEAKPKADASSRVAAETPVRQSVVEDAVPARAVPTPAEVKPAEQAPVAEVSVSEAFARDAAGTPVLDRSEAPIEDSVAEMPTRGRPLRQSVVSRPPVVATALSPEVPIAEPQQVMEAEAAPVTPAPPVFAKAAPQAAPAPVSAPAPVPAPAPVASVPVPPIVIAAEAPVPVSAAPVSSAPVSPAPVAHAPQAAPSVSSTAILPGTQSTPMHDVAPPTRSSAPEGDLREIPYSAARLGGLRNLLVSLGLRSLNSRDGELHEAADAGPEHRNEVVAERVTERPVYAEPLVPLAPAGDPEIGFDPALVTAAPEFLPPRPVVEVTEKEPEKEVRTPTAPRKKGWDSSDEINTLPSWRGQYRKRR